MTDSSHGAGMMVATGRLTAEGGVCGDVTASCAQLGGKEHDSMLIGMVPRK